MKTLLKIVEVGHKTMLKNLVPIKCLSLNKPRR
jgi:hypothetical protein